MLRKFKQAAKPKAPVEGMRTVTGFGQVMKLKTLTDRRAIRETETRLADVYERFLCATPTARKGVALDIGAASGEFALPFAKAHPDWVVYCFEPDAAAFARLSENIRSTGAKNVKAFNVAVGPEAKGDMAAVTKALTDGKADAVAKACKPAKFSSDAARPGHLVMAKSGGSTSYPTVPANALVGLGPTLVKLTAPMAEAAILTGLREAQIDHVIGELAEQVPTHLFFSPDKAKGQRYAYLPIADESDLAIRKWPEIGTQKPGLDVVVAMYNTRDYIVECVEGIINNTADDVRALVVDDGSTDGCGDLVQEAFGNNPRVVLLRKPNGGCASARNYGRMHSNATHVTFVDADDIIDAEMFPQLLELARLTGSEVVQAGFDFLFMNEDGTTRTELSYEQSDGFKEQFKGKPFGAKDTYRVIPSKELMVGQPTIWRRVYRRDFLENRDIWFPEHIRAFDDQIFQMLTLHYAGNVPAIDHLRYHYRQHPGQDIKQGDERFFYSLEMFRAMVKRGIREGWNDFEPLLRSYVNTVNWIHGGLRADLKPKFLKGAAQLWVMMQRTLGSFIFNEVSDVKILAPDFEFHVLQASKALEGFNNSYAWIYLDALEMHAPMVKMPDPMQMDAAAGPATTPRPDPVQAAIEAMGGTVLKTASDLAGMPIATSNAKVALQVPNRKPELYLDGIVDAGRTGLAGMLTFPFTGTHWQFRQGLDGAFTILNQGEEDNCLAVVDGEVRLMAHKPGAPTRWHVFKIQNKVGLCTLTGYVLAVKNGAPIAISVKDAKEMNAGWLVRPV